MSLTERNLNIPPEHIANIFGLFDTYMKTIERTFHVTVVVRNDSIKLLGSGDGLRHAEKVFHELLALAVQGTEITEQNVSYAISLAVKEQSVTAS